MEEPEKKSEEKNKERENDILLQDYLIWKKHFIKISLILGVKLKTFHKDLINIRS